MSGQAKGVYGKPEVHVLKGADAQAARVALHIAHAVQSGDLREGAQLVRKLGIEGLAVVHKQITLPASEVSELLGPPAR